MKFESLRLEKIISEDKKVHCEIIFGAIPPDMKEFMNKGSYILLISLYDDNKPMLFPLTDEIRLGSELNSTVKFFRDNLALLAKQYLDHYLHQSHEDK